MPTPRMTMKAIQEVIRLHAAGLSQRQIAQACRLSKGAVGKYLQKAEQASISWPLSPEMDPAKLEALLFPSHRSATVTAPVMPDFAAIHTEMRRKGVNQRYPLSTCQHQDFTALCRENWLSTLPKEGKNCQNMIWSWVNPLDADPR